MRLTSTVPTFHSSKSTIWMTNLEDVTMGLYMLIQMCLIATTLIRHHMYTHFNDFRSTNI